MPSINQLLGPLAVLLASFTAPARTRQHCPYIQGSLLGPMLLKYMLNQEGKAKDAKLCISDCKLYQSRAQSSVTNAHHHQRNLCQELQLTKGTWEKSRKTQTANAEAAGQRACLTLRSHN